MIGEVGGYVYVFWCFCYFVFFLCRSVFFIVGMSC